MRRLPTRALLALGLAMPALLAGAVVPLSAQPALYALKDDATGGDCVQKNIGRWDAATKTCALTGNLRASIVIADDGVSLDGNQHSLKAPAQALPFGVLAKNRTRVTVNGVAIDGFSQGVALDGGFGNTVLKNVITDAAGQGGCGVCLFQSDDNRVESNRITGVRGQGIRLDRSSRNRVLKNVLRQNVLQIFMDQSMKNVVDGNTIEGNPALLTDGIVMSQSNDNGVTRNQILRQGGVGAMLDKSDRNGFLFNEFISDGFPAAFLLQSGTDNLAICNDFAGLTNRDVNLSPAAAGTLVALNNFLRNDFAQDLAPAGANRFDTGATGNYWSRNAAACVDANGDGFCDAPYVFIGNQDNRPWFKPVPWRFFPSACFTASPSIGPPPESAARLVAIEWGLAVANGNEQDIAGRLAPDVQLTTADGTVIAGGEAVVAYLKKTLTGRRFLVETIETAASGIVVRGQVLGPRGAEDAPSGATLEIRASGDGRWRIVRIRRTSQ